MSICTGLWLCLERLPPSAGTAHSDCMSLAVQRRERVLASSSACCSSSSSRVGGCMGSRLQCYLHQATTRLASELLSSRVEAD